MYILGLCVTNHDTSACLLKDGRIIAAAEEERFIRIKHAWAQMPQLASRFCLTTAGIELDDVDYVVTAFAYQQPEDVRIFTRKEVEARHVDEMESYFPSNMFPRRGLPALAHVKHHLAHASSAYRCSLFDRATILVLDGRGEDASTTVAIGDSNTIKCMQSFDISQSLGIFYSSVSHYIGLGRMSEGKAMGLAAYGNQKYDFDLIKLTPNDYVVEWNRGVPRKDEDSPSGNCQTEIISAWGKYLERQFGTANKSRLSYDPSRGEMVNRSAFPQLYCDIIASAQGKLEEAVMHLAQSAVEKTGCRNLVIAGGVGLNCTLNGKLACSEFIDNLFVQPAANDAGTSIGAALELYSYLGHPATHSMVHARYGPSFSEQQIKDCLDSVGVRYTYCNDPAYTTANLLASPSVAGMRDHLNYNVKHREAFRPYALSVAIESCDDIFNKWQHSPHMLMGFRVKSSAMADLAEGIHVDGTTRPQTVVREDYPLMWQLLDNYYRLTGSKGIINSSFNDHGEPLVCTPLDALRTFYSTAIDVLMLGNFLVLKT